VAFLEISGQFSGFFPMAVAVTLKSASGYNTEIKFLILNIIKIIYFY
jgi:hypothetical protein